MVFVSRSALTSPDQVDADAIALHSPSGAAEVLARVQNEEEAPGVLVIGEAEGEREEAQLVAGGAVLPDGTWADSYLVPLSHAGDLLGFDVLSLVSPGNQIFSNPDYVQVN